MAKYIGSPWGAMLGKLQDAVGGKWKGINWTRTHFLPTQRGTLQLYQQWKDGEPVVFSLKQFNFRRLSNSPLGYISRINLETFINVIWDKFVNQHQYKMTGSNAFMKANAANLFASMPHIDQEFDPTTNSPDLKVIKVSDGDLEPTSNIIAATYNTGTGVLGLTWNTTCYTNGQASDQAWIIALRKPILDSWGRWGNWMPALFMYGPTQSSLSNRVNSGGSITLPTGLTAADLTAYLYFRDAAGLIGFSQSKSKQVTAP